MLAFRGQQPGGDHRAGDEARIELGRLQGELQGLLRPALLEAGGLSSSSVVRTTVFLADMDDFSAMNEVYATFFTQPYPARSTVQTARLPRDARIEIDVIASYDA